MAVKKPAPKAPVEKKAEAVTCLSCGAEYPLGRETCPACGALSR